MPSAGDCCSTCRRHKGRSDRGHMSIGSIGSLDGSVALSPLSRDGSPTAAAEAETSSGAGGIFGSAYQVSLCCIV